MSSGHASSQPVATANVEDDGHDQTGGPDGNSSIVDTSAAGAGTMAQQKARVPGGEAGTASESVEDGGEGVQETASDYLQGLMLEFSKLEGKLAHLLLENSRLGAENAELRSRPPENENASALQDLENLTTKYTKVKKLYFQREQQVEDFTKDIEVLQNERDDLLRDLDILTKDRDTLRSEQDLNSRELNAIKRERDTIIREKEAIMRERDAVVREKDAIARIKDDAVNEKREEAAVERENARAERDRLQSRIRDLEDQVTALHQQVQSNGVDKRRSAPVTAKDQTGPQGGAGYTDEILKLKYDKVKRLYYEQIKHIDSLQEQVRNMNIGKAVGDDHSSGFRKVIDELSRGLTEDQRFKRERVI